MNFRHHALEQFNIYASKYNLEDVKIRLKYDHMLRVADRAELIASSLGYSSEDLDIVWLMGLLHDIGRFEQVRQYGTFIDARSIDHAALSSKVLFSAEETGPMIRSFLPEESSFDSVINAAIRCHSMYRIPEDYDDHSREWSKILRDADKLDIFRVMTETPLEDIYNVTTEELYSAPVTSEVLQCFNEGHAVLRSLKKTPIDNLAGHICLFYELEFSKSRELAIEEGYLRQMLSFESNNPDTRRVFEHMRRELL